MIIEKIKAFIENIDFSKINVKNIIAFLKKILVAVKNSFVTETDSEKIKKVSEKRLAIVAYSVLSFILIIGIVCGSVANSFLNKVNYGDIQGKVSDTLDEEEEIVFDVEKTAVINTDETTTATDDKEKTEEKEDKVIKTGVKEVIPENEGYKQVESSAEIEVKANNDIKQNIEEDNSIWYSDDVFNILVVGYDAGDAEKVMFEGATLPRSDAIMIASINKVKKTIKLVSLSRATYVAIPEHGNKRLNTAHAYGGATTLIETIELNYKVRIDKFISVDFDGFEAIVDAIGGVSVGMTQAEAQFTFNTDDIEKGVHLMNGKQAIRYVRLRKIDSDRARTGRQRRLLKNMFYKARNMSLSEDLKFLNAVLPYVNTNYTKSELVDEATNAQTYLKWEWSEDIIPHNAIQLTMRDGKEVIILDWKETVDYVHDILYSGVKVKKK